MLSCIHTMFNSSFFLIKKRCFYIIQNIILHTIISVYIHLNERFMWFMKQILTAFLLIDKYITCIPFFRFKQNMQFCSFYYSCNKMASSYSTFCFILRTPFTFRHATTSNIKDAIFKEQLLYINETTNPHNGNETLPKKNPTNIKYKTSCKYSHG